MPYSAIEEAQPHNVMDYLLKDVMDYIGRKRGSVLRTLLIISCMCAVSLPLHAASSAAQAYQSASAASVELLRDLDKKKDRVSWMAVIHKYQNVGKQYPRSNYTQVLVQGGQI